MNIEGQIHQKNPGMGQTPTAPTLSGDPKYFSWGPSTAEMGTQKAYI